MNFEFDRAGSGNWYLSDRSDMTDESDWSDQAEGSDGSVGLEFEVGGEWVSCAYGMTLRCKCGYNGVTICIY